MVKDFENLGIQIPEILLPNKQVDLSKWSVVACDQYTSELEYWEKVASLVGDAPSTLNLVYPEAYLGKEDGTERIHNIHRKMRDYLEDEVLAPVGRGFILVERRTSHALSRKGLIVALDLECYDYHKGARTLIRATEGTVLERIPPRVKIREQAIIELPHIMVLIDDLEQLVIEPVARQAQNLDKLYSVDLMANGGHIDGYHVNDAEIVAGIIKGLNALADRSLYNNKYGLNSQEVLLYAVGDGNHSLATAKAVWEKIKQNSAKSLLDLINHPARYALVELVNIHDPGIVFEPIHRVVFNIKVNQFLNSMSAFYRNVDSEFNYRLYSDRTELQSKLANLREQHKDTHFVEFTSEKGRGIIEIKQRHHNLEAGTLQAFLDDFAGNNTEAEIDYIHGEEVVARLGSKAGNIGFYLPSMAKGDLFKTVIVDGVLPRKTFSMGEADEKRFYMECRKIITTI